MPNKGPQSMESVEVAAELLKEKEGKISDWQVEQAVREVGGRIGRVSVAGIRHALGFPPFVAPKIEATKPMTTENEEVKEGRTRLYGAMAVAARRLGVGFPVRGQGKICQDVSNEHVAQVKDEAARMALAVLHGDGQRVEKPVIDLTKQTMTGKPRLRHMSDPKTAKEIIKKALIEAGGVIANWQIQKLVHDAGVGVNASTITEMRKALGFSGLRTGARKIEARLKAVEAFREQQAAVPAPTEPGVEPALGPGTGPVPFIPAPPTERGRQRLPRDYEAAKKIAFQVMADAVASGRVHITNKEVRREVRKRGIGLGDRGMALVRKQWDRHVRYCKQRNLPLVEAPLVIEQQPQEEEEEVQAQEKHPLVNLIVNLAEKFGLVYLHWEKGGDLVIREAQEKRFKL